ncbi:MAG: hypothetical protein H6974_16215 [Gammaproteobacteria bacterium]|jgi:hypothetical protein|nr:hypothetical protein [Gammaproteobacteria bacterium]
MALLNLTAASRAVGVNRSTIVRALKAGRLSATTNEESERCIDTAELMRVFGVLKTDAQGDAPADAYPLHRHAIGDAQGQDALIEVLQEQLRQANEREREGREREARLLAMLEVEQSARRELETKLLPAPVPPPKPAPPSHRRVWVLLILLVAVLAFAAWRWWDAIRAMVAVLVKF